MWHDNETTTDYLNFGVVADACAKLLQQANGQPISIGVSGGWDRSNALVHRDGKGAASCGRARLLVQHRASRICIE
ncbi:hypothetical protein LMG8323_03903 [Ralstonia mannitolilytica]|nr:hypothetical protein LMG8323_03903 [Ralstonia mannitolilytica]